MPDASTFLLFATASIAFLAIPGPSVFYGALLPRVPAAVRRPPAGPIAPQMLVLGTLLVGLGVVSDGTYALVAAGAGSRLRETAAARRVLDRMSGCVFVGLSSPRWRASRVTDSGAHPRRRA